MPIQPNKPEYAQLPVYCVVCTRPVPAERLARHSVTCCPEHNQLRHLALRSKKEARRCKYCHQPSTPRQREQFALWRKTQSRVRRSEAIPQLLANLPLVLRTLREAGVRINALHAEVALKSLIEVAEVDETVAMPDLRPAPADRVPVPTYEGFEEDDQDDEAPNAYTL